MLDHDDARTLSDAIGLVHDAPDRDAFAHQAVIAVERCSHSAFTGYNEVDPDADRFRYIARPEGRDFPGAGELMARYQHHHPIIRYLRETGDGSAHKISDFVTDEEFRRNPLYEHVYARTGIHWQMSISMPAPEPLIVALVATRPEDEPDFDERDRLMLNLLRPHLAQSYVIAMERERLRALVDIASAALAAEGAFVVVVDDPPAELTPGALALLHRAFGAPRRGAPLPERVSTWLERERARWRRHPGADGGLLQPLVARREGRRVVARLVPGAAYDALVVREEARTLPATELERLGLTPREAQVLTLVVDGLTNAQIAATLHVEPSTVKTHLEHVYRKLGVRGRVPATTLVVDLLGGKIRRSAD